MSYKIEEAKAEDKEKGVMWAVALCVLAVMLIFLGYYADKEEKLAMHNNTGNSGVTMEAPKKMKSPELSPEVTGVTKNV